MDKVVVKTKKTFDAKWIEIEGHFLKANPNWDGSLHRNNPRLRTLFKKEPHGLVLPPPGYKSEIISYPREYPGGITLVLVKKCPYCSTSEVIADTATWQSRADYRPTTQFFLGGYNDIRGEIRNLNPGICTNCVDQLYREYLEKQSKGKGFWDSFFG